MKANYWGFSLFLLALLAACGHRQEAVETKPESKTIRVKTVQVNTSSDETALRYSGSIEPSVTIPLSFQNMGTVKNVYVEEGDFVKKGKLLANLDNKDMTNMHQIALSKFQQAQDAYNRLKTVYDEGSLPEIKWIEMETNLEQARSSLELAKNNLEKCDLYSPDDGVIGKRNVEPGQSSIGIINAPFELVKIQTVFVKISVPENEISKIRKGQTAGFKVAALNGKTFEGVISIISPVADAISRTYNAKISVNNTNLELKPGMVCDVILNLSSSGDKMVIPNQAVSTDADGKAFVFVVSSDKQSVKKQFITTGNYQDTGIEVTSGLNPGETIVVGGKEKLTDNSLISL